MLKIPTHFPKIFFKLNKIHYGEKLKMLGWPFIFRFPRAQITIGSRVSINSSFWSNLLGLYQRTIIVAKGCGKIDIGNQVGISGATIYAWQEISIGDNTLVGANVKIMDTDFHPMDSQARLNHESKATKTAPVIIGKNVFIGANAIVLKGTEIGDNCVVGAGAVVSGKFDDNCVIVGNPARVIRRSVDGEPSDK